MGRDGESFFDTTHNAGIALATRPKPWVGRIIRNMQIALAQEVQNPTNVHHNKKWGGHETTTALRSVSNYSHQKILAEMMVKRSTLAMPMRRAADAN